MLSLAIRFRVASVLESLGYGYTYAMGLGYNVKFGIDHYMMRLRFNVRFS